MAAKPETTFTASVHKHLPPLSQLYRMKNNNQFNSGIADVWYSGKHDLWAEYKFIVVPKRDTTMIDLVGGKDPPISKLQQEWLRDRHNEGRDVWVIVGCKEGGVVFMARCWEQPFTAAQFRAWVGTRAEVARSITNFTS